MSNRNDRLGWNDDGDASTCDNVPPVPAPSWSDGKVTVPARRDDVRAYEIDGDTVLFEPRGKNMMLLNDTAIAVWQRCDGLRTIRDTAEEMSREYDVTFDTALDHVEALVALFSSSDLLNHETA